MVLGNCSGKSHPAARAGTLSPMEWHHGGHYGKGSPISWHHGGHNYMGAGSNHVEKIAIEDPSARKYFQRKRKR